MYFSHKTFKLLVAGAFYCTCMSPAVIEAQSGQAYLVKDAAPGVTTSEGSSPRDFCQIGNITYFVADGPGGTELYRTDGTSAGTWRVKDIDPVGSSFPQDLYNFNGTLYFSARSDFGRELWKSDGTEAGTVMVADINPAGPSMEDNEEYRDFLTADFTEYNGHLYFRASATLSGFSPPNPLQLFRTDGTAAGTVQVGVGPNPSSPLLRDVKEIEAAAGHLFVMNHKYRADELWVTDGTDAGTSEISLPGLTVEVANLTAVNDALFFSILTGDEPSDASLYKTDGTAAGTQVVKLFAEDGIGYDDAFIDNLTAFGDKVVFSAGDSATGPEPWISDGSPGGTVMLANINPQTLESGAGHGSYPSNFTVIGDKVWFAADHTQDDYDPSNIYSNFHPDEDDLEKDPWITDGTPVGTRQVIDLENDGLRFGDAMDHPGAFTQFNGKTYFVAGHDLQWYDEKIPEATVFQSDGTAAGTSKLSPGYFWERSLEMPRELFARPDKLLLNGGRYNPATDRPDRYAGNSELWASNGTSDGTVLIKEIGKRPKSSYPELGFTFLDFLIYSDSAGAGLSLSNGTSAGTFDPLVGAVEPLVRAGNRFLFMKVVEGIFTNTIELFSTDGTEAGIIAVQPGKDYLFEDPEFFAFGNRALFLTDDPDTHDDLLYVTDGTSAGTIILVSDPEGIDNVTIVSPTFALFTVDDRSQLWKTDGTLAGTQVIYDAGFAEIEIQTVINQDLILFTSGGNGSLWRTDGTAAGTVLVSDDDHYNTTFDYDHEVQEISKLGNKAVIFLSNGFFTKLWTTDGTTAGTSVVPDSISFSSSQFVTVLETVNDKMFFEITTDGFEPGDLEGDTGSEPWVYDDGTGEITFLGDLRPGPVSSLPAGMRAGRAGSPAIVHEGILFFQAHDGVHGAELWRSDGTVAGTYMVADLNPGASSSMPSNFFVVGSALFFSAVDASAGNELFVLDSRDGQPRLFQDLNPGQSSSNPSGFYAVPALKRVFFSATTDAEGNELWALPYEGGVLPTAADLWQLYE